MSTQGKQAKKDRDQGQEPDRKQEETERQFGTHSYLETAEDAMRFINTRKRTAPEGIYFSIEDAASGKPSYYDEICMYAGASGILCFLLALHEDTGKREYLEEAEDVGSYLNYRWRHARELKRNFSKYAFSTGWGGAAFALIQLYETTKKEAYKALAADILDEAMQEAKPSPDGAGMYWSSYPGIVGNAGTILVFLRAAEALQNERWRSFAVEAGRLFLNKGRDMGDGGVYYSGVDPTYFGAGRDYIDPNFPMGTAGIGFALLKLYEASRDRAFLDAVKGVPEYMSRIAVKMKAGSLLPHALPDRPDLFYLGYCHGPAGTARFYYELWRLSKDAKYKKDIDVLVSGLESMGAPEKRSAGYWNVDNICCGTAGILNMYLGLWAAFSEEHDLEMAERCGHVLMRDAVYEETPSGLAAHWKFALDRVAPERLSTPVGFMDGAAGIGAVLLQLDRAERGKFRTLRMIDDPFPEKKMDEGTRG